MRIRRPRGITNTQILVVSTVGILGGVYIWKPLLERWKLEDKTTKASKQGKQRQFVTFLKANLIFFRMNTVFKNLKQSASGLVGMAVISTTVLVLGHRFFWKPRQERYQRNEAQAIADYIFENENK